MQATLKLAQMVDLLLFNFKHHTLIKKRKMGSGAKSYMKKGFLIYEEMRKFFPIYEKPVSDI